MLPSPAAPRLSVSRRHGLGDMLMALPVLDEAHARGRPVHLCTRPEWIPALRAFRPHFAISDIPGDDTVDLDRVTADALPTEHRADEFADHLAVDRPTRPMRVSVPGGWRPPDGLPPRVVAFGPEAGHPAREWPSAHAAELARAIRGSPSVLLGTNPEPALEADTDLRGRLSLEELFAVVRRARVLVCMDSGLLHVGIAAGAPTVALFGGIDPCLRVRPWDRVIVIRRALSCSPCNKRERCGGRYFCMREVLPEVVLQAIHVAAAGLAERQVWDL